MGIYSNARDVDPGAGVKRPPLPEGDYPELMVERCQEFDANDPAKRGAHYFKSDHEVLVATPQCAVGVGGTLFVQDAGNKYRDHDVKGIGQVKAFLGAALGMADKATIKTSIGEEEILGACAGNGTSLAGHVFRAKVTHRKGDDGEVYPQYECYPVLNPDGTPKVVDPVTRQPLAGARPAPAAAPARPTAPMPPPPAAVAPPAPKTPPAGWAWHPEAAYAAQGWTYELANPSNMRQL